MSSPRKGSIPGQISPIPGSESTIAPAQPPRTPNRDRDNRIAPAPASLFDNVTVPIDDDDAPPCSSSTAPELNVVMATAANESKKLLLARQTSDSSSKPTDSSDQAASYRPASLTVSATPRNVSIIINPMEAPSNSGVVGRNASAATNAGAAAASASSRYHPTDVGGEEAAGSGCSGSQNGTESPGTSQMSPPPSYHDIPGTVPAHRGVSRGPPPSYEDAVDPNGEPPSYDSLFGRIRDTHKASRNFIDFLVKLLILLVGTIGCTIICSITVVIPVCMIVIGSIYFDECPAEPYIPIFLIVGGERNRERVRFPGLTELY